MEQVRAPSYECDNFRHYPVLERPCNPVIQVYFEIEMNEHMPRKFANNMLLVRIEAKSRVIGPIAGAAAASDTVVMLLPP